MASGLMEEKTSALETQFQALRAIFEVDAKQARLKELTAEVARDGFWDAPDATERVLRERKVDRDVPRSLVVA